MVAAEEVIFPSQSNRPDDIFSQIVIPEQASVLQTSHHVVPSGIGIRDGFPDLGIGAVLDSFRFHPHSHGIHDRSGQFPALRLPLVVRQARLIAAVFNPVNMLYLGQAMFGHLPVFIQSLFKMTADMHQAVEQPHVGVGPEGCLIACKTVALKITLEVILICQGFDDCSGTRSLIVMEDDQSLHDRPYHPQVFLVGPVLFLVDDRNSGFVRLYIVAGKDFLLELLIQRPEQLHRLFEPSVQRTFRKAFHPKMPVLLYLPVERDVIFILLKQYLGKQAGVGDALVDGHQRHGGNLHAFLPCGRKPGAVLERIFGTDDFLDIEHPRFVLDHFGYLFANPTI